MYKREKPGNQTERMEKRETSHTQTREIDKRDKSGQQMGIFNKRKTSSHQVGEIGKIIQTDESEASGQHNEKQDNKDTFNHQDRKSEKILSSSHSHQNKKIEVTSNANELRKKANRLRNDTEFWYQTWVNNGKPDSGHIFDKHNITKDKSRVATKEYKAKAAEEKVEKEKRRKNSVIKISSKANYDSIGTTGRTCLYT